MKLTNLTSMSKNFSCHLWYSVVVWGPESSWVKCAPPRFLHAVISCIFWSPVWHPTHSNRLRIGAGLGHQNTSCQLCWGARWPWMRCGARPWRQVKWKTYRWSSWRVRPGAMFIMCSSISSTKFARSRKGNAVNLRWNVKTWRLVVGGAGGWWSWGRGGLVVMVVGLFVMFGTFLVQMKLALWQGQILTSKQASGAAQG